MELPELSLAPTLGVTSGNMSFDQYSESNASRKRKLIQDHTLLMKTNNHQSSLQPSVDLHLTDPLPLDWEQCLDLESGKMYYMNRRTLRKSWKWPIRMEQVDLELNISTLSGNNLNSSDHKKKQNHLHSAENSNNNNMVALACLNCHLLVILSKSSPTCPNCKYVHSLPSQNGTTNLAAPTQTKVAAVKSLNTLSLLN